MSENPPIEFERTPFARFNENEGRILSSFESKKGQTSKLKRALRALTAAALVAASTPAFAEHTTRISETPNLQHQEKDLEPRLQELRGWLKGTDWERVSGFVLAPPLEKTGSSNERIGIYSENARASGRERPEIFVSHEADITADLEHFTKEEFIGKVQQFLKDNMPPEFFERRVRGQRRTSRQILNKQMTSQKNN